MHAGVESQHNLSGGEELQVYPLYQSSMQD